MYNFLLGSPTGRPPLQRNTHTPKTYRRRQGPLFPTTPMQSVFSTPANSPPPVNNTASSSQSFSSSTQFTGIAPSVVSSIELRIDPNDGNQYNLASFIREYGGSVSQPPAEWKSAAPANFGEMQLPWGQFNGPSSLFRISPPKLKYPSGSTDDNVNLHFIRSALGYLRSSTYVRDVIDWDARPHPFYFYKPLQSFYASQGFSGFQFDPSKTLDTLHWVESLSPDFGTELRSLYNFGGVLSYSNINERIYHTVYAWLDHSTVGGDVHLLAGIDASDGVFDGVSLLRVVVESLRVVRSKDIALQAQRFSKKITDAVFIMRVGGMQAYMGEIDHHRLALINIRRPLTDAEILGRVQATLAGRHSQIDKCFRDMRIDASKSGIETTFSVAKTQLIDTFRYDVPDSVKTEKTKQKEVDANLAKKLHDHDDRKPLKRRPQKTRGIFPKGSCKHHPESISHTTDHCYIEIRNKKGLPPGEKWCEVHTRGTHYDSVCSRHPGNNKRKRKRDSPRKAEAVLAKAVTEQIAALFSHAEQRRTNPPPPPAASPSSSDRETMGPPTDMTAPMSAESVFTLISKLDEGGRRKLKTLLQS